MSELSEDPQVVADREGLDLVLPGPTELFIDIDDAESEVQMQAAIKCLSDNGDVVVETKRTVSRSGNTHVYLKLDRVQPLDPIERLAFQACFGSDRTRELLGLLRATRQYPIPSSCFFEIKPQQVK